VPRYSEERKAVVLAKLSPPHSMTVAALAREEGISDQTLYNWRTQAREEGRPVPGSKAKSDQWSAEAKLATVIETAALSEEELSQYCREKVFYPRTSPALERRVSARLPAQCRAGKGAS